MASNPVANGAVPELFQGTKKNPFEGTMNEDFGNVIKIVLIVVVMLVIVFVAMYIVNMFKSNSLKEVKLTNEIVAMDNRMSLPRVILSNTITTAMRGQEFSFNFWIYLSESYDKTTQHKVIFQRGNEAVSNGTSLPSMLNEKTSPIVVMDKDTNKMMIAVNTSNVKSGMTLFDIFQKDPTTKRYKGPYLITSIDYVPLQRWVNITISVRDSMLTVFMDSDLYSIVTTIDATNEYGNIPFIRIPSGDITIGDPRNSTRGFLTKFRYYNYALAQNQIQKLYNEGPANTSFLSWFGLSRYGVRSPVYELDGGDA